MDLRIEGGRPLRGTANVAADKSLVHRALILSALAEGSAQIEARSPGLDNGSTAAALKALGVDIQRESVEAITRFSVAGRGPRALRAPARPIDCGNSGTTMRLLAGVVAGAGLDATLSGDASLSRRPMGRVCEPLRAMGAAIRGEQQAQRELPPLRCSAGEFVGGAHRSVVASAQVKSALLLAGVVGGRTVDVTEPHLSRDHTERMLMAMGAPLERQRTADGARVVLPGQVALAATDVVVPGDISSAAFLLAAALTVPGSELLVRDVGVNPTRTGLLEILEEVGAAVTVTRWREVSGEPVADITASFGPMTSRRPGGGPTLVAGEVVVRAIDELVILAAVAAGCEGVFEVRDARELRVKESDRVRATVELLSAFGIDAEEREDGFTIAGPQRPVATRVAVGNDHRLAMTAAVLALGAEGESVLEGFDIAEVSFPGFVEQLEALGGAVRRDPAP